VRMLQRAKREKEPKSADAIIDEEATSSKAGIWVPPR